MPRRKDLKRDNNMASHPVKATVRFSDAELDAVHEAANSMGYVFQRWARTRLMAAVRFESGEGTFQECLAKVEEED